MDGRRIRRSARRLLAVLAAVSAGSLFLSSPALAQSIGALTGPTSTSEAAPASPVQAAGAVVQQAAPAVEQVTAPVAQAAAPLQQVTAPAAEAAAPVAQQTAPVVHQATAPVTESVAPVVEQATAPVTEAAAPVVSQVAEPVAQAIAPVVQVATSVTAPLASKTVGPLSPVRGGTTKAKTVDEIVGLLTTAVTEGRSPAGGQPIADQSKTPASSTHLGPTRSARATVAGRGAEARYSASFREALVVTPSLPGNSQVTADSNRGPSATAPRKPRLPGLPRGPAGPGSSAAPIQGGSAPIFVAALVAALLLAAPGLSRRLRLNLASWPLPIALPSLERPG